jgi:hypothetical protein
LRLEAQIEKLTEAIERCRKAILVSKVAIAAGGIWLLAFTLGAIRFDPMAMIAAISAVIGGTVVFGSNTSTSKQALVETTAAVEPGPQNVMAITKKRFRASSKIADWYRHLVHATKRLAMSSRIRSLPMTAERRHCDAMRNSQTVNRTPALIDEQSRQSE